VQAAWSTYLAATRRSLGGNQGAARFDVVPLWRAHGAGSSAGGPDTGADKLAASIATDIRLRIAEGRLQVGDQLPPLPELSVEFGASRPTIRECLRILEVEGLIDLRTGSRHGARILEPTTEMAGQLASVMLAAAGTRMIDVVEARQLIEPSVIELMAGRADAETLASLVDRVRKLEELADDTPAFVDYIEDLERHAFAATGNPAVSVALEMIHWVTIRSRRDVLMRAASVPQVIRSNRRAGRTIERCFEAAGRGDAEGAGQAWAEHLHAVSPFFRNAYGDRLIVDLFD
jgi:DNA-binding FadR family transcriptional regulator